ncbi:MAG: lysophospholipid acyltransferase family protein, partial [Oscillospiraceae bacterium]
VSDGSYDEVHAFFVAEKGQEEEAVQRLKARSAELSQNQKLSGIHCVQEIPKTSLQKPKRFLLKKMFLGEQQGGMAAEMQPLGNNPASIVKLAIARVSGTSEFTMGTRLFQELAIDSLGSLDLAYEIDEKCGVRVEHLLHKEMTVGELVECAVSPVIGGQSAPENPYPMKKTKYAYRLFSFFRNLIKGFYRVKVENDDFLPQNSGYIICANHVSNFDFLYLTLNFTKERFAKFCCMAKKELFQNNIFSKAVANVCGMIPVDRDGLVAGSMASIQERLTDQWGVLIHPEGTRSETGKLGAFKNGAAVLSIDSGAPIVPAYIKGGYEIFPSSKKLPQLYDWKRKCKYQVEVIYGEPIFPGGRSPEELMAEIKKAMTALANKKAAVRVN